MHNRVDEEGISSSSLDTYFVSIHARKKSEFYFEDEFTVSPFCVGQLHNIKSFQVFPLEKYTQNCVFYTSTQNKQKSDT